MEAVQARSAALADRRSADGGPFRAERMALVRKVAALASGYRGREGLVIGIEGPWGAGKTAFTGHVLQALRGDAATTLLPFNPWSLSDQHALVGEFVSALSASLGGERGEPRVPVSYAARLRASAARSLRFAQRSPAAPRAPHEERGDIEQKLARLEGRLVVIIEDIDRLDHEQTRLVMKLVRIAASLPNLVLLLVYDRARVSESLREEGRPGEDVLKTLVHIAFTLPEPTRQELNGVLFAQLRETVARTYGDAHRADDDERWRALVHGTLPVLFATIAEVSGFAGSLRLAWSAVGAQTVNMTDFTGIEAIRFFAPQLYSAMASNRTLLAGARIDASDDAAERASRYEDLLRHAPEDKRAALDAVVRFLFHRIRKEHDAQEVEDAWRAERRVCAPEHFAAYFQLGIPASGVSETDVLFLRRRFGDSQAVAGFLRTYLDDGRLGALLALVPTQRRIVSEADARALLLGLWTLEPEVEAGDTQPREETRAIALELARNLLCDAIPPARRAEFLDSVVAATQAKSLPAALLAALERDPLS